MLQCACKLGTWAVLALSKGAASCSMIVSAMVGAEPSILATM
jgi:hypothetical protein